jgi:hypothetical protein
MSDAPSELTPVPATLPPTSVPVMQADNSFSLPWRRFFQQLWNRTGGQTDQIATGQNELAAEVAEALATANQAEADAKAALTAAEIGALFGPVGISKSQESGDSLSIGDVMAFNRPTVPDNGGDVLALVALGRAAEAMSSGGSNLAVENHGTQVTAAATQIDFTGGGVITTASGSNVTVTVTGGAGSLPTPYGPPNPSIFTTNVGGGTLSVDPNTGGATLNAGAPTGGDSWKYVAVAAPATPWTLCVRLQGSFWISSGVPDIGIVLSDSSGKLVTLAMTTRNNYGDVQIDYWNSPTSFYQEPLQAQFQRVEHLRVTNDGTNLNFYISADGTNWIEVGSLSQTAWLAAGPTLIGFGYDTSTTGAPANWQCIVNCLYWSLVAGTTPAQWANGGPGGPGTVTSVGLTVPSEFVVSGSPITSSGTLAISKANQSANSVYAGPASGAAATPTFRAMVAADFPALPYVSNAAQAANLVLAGPASGSAATPTYRALVAKDFPVPLVLNANTGTPPSGASGYVLQVVGPTGTFGNIDFVGVADGAGLITRKCNGNLSAPTAVASGDAIGFLTARGYNGSAWTTPNAAGIIFTARQNWTTSANGCSTDIYACPNGGTVAALVARFDQDGTFEQTTMTVSQLPSSSGNVGKRAFVTDSSVGSVGNFGALVSGGGSNAVPVWCDGSNWRIG